MPIIKLDTPGLSTLQREILTYFNIGDMAVMFTHASSSWENRGLILSQPVLEHEHDGVILKCQMLYYPEKKNLPLYIRKPHRERGRPSMHWKAEKTLLSELKYQWKAIKNDG